MKYASNCPSELQGGVYACYKVGVESPVYESKYLINACEVWAFGECDYIIDTTDGVDLCNISEVI